MAHLALTLEIALVAVIVCAVHRLKPHVGLIPFYMAVGLITAMLFVTGKPEGSGHWVLGVLWPLDVTHPVSHTVYLPALLVAFVVVYVLEGTREARRLFVGIALFYVLHGLVEAQVDFHAAHPPPGVPPRPADYAQWLDVRMRIASITALLLDVAVIIVAYQYLRNKLPRLPLAVPLFVGLVAAMTVDAVVYGLIEFGSFILENFLFGPKLVSGVAAGLPAAIYLQRRLHQLPPGERRGAQDRDALEILHLRREVEHQRRMYEDVKKTFGRYVSPEVVDLITADPSKLQLGGEERVVAIVFVDIRGYSTLSETLSPSETLDTLNRFFAEVNRIVQAEGGMVNNFLGDGVLAVFGAPLAVSGHCDRAVRAGLGILRAVEGLNRIWEAEGMLDRWRVAGLDGMAVRVGIHAGPVVVGNLGSEQRTDYAVIGDVVNTAARLEALNKELGTDILMSDAVAASLTDEGLTRVLVPLGAKQVKGRQGAVEVLTVRAGGGGVQGPERISVEHEGT